MAETWLHEHTNRGRLFEVEPGIGDIVSWEMLCAVRAMQNDFNRTAFVGREFTIPIKVQKRAEQYGPRFVPADQLPLVKPMPKCSSSHEAGESYLTCDLDAGHDGPHFDATSHIEWRSR